MKLVFFKIACLTVAMVLLGECASARLVPCPATTKFVCTSGVNIKKVKSGFFLGFCPHIMSTLLDPDVEIMFLTGKLSYTPQEKLKVLLSPQFNRKTLPKTYEQNIEQIWSDRLKLNSTLWNGTKFRIDKVSMENDIVTFCLGITCYKDFLGTNWSPEAKQLHELGESDFNNSQAYMSDALGVGSLVKTADEQCILIKRSLNCAEAAGLYDIPGGHPEPQVK